MTYILSLASADDDLEVWVGGLQIKSHSPFALAGHKGPWQFEAQVGDPIRVVAWDNWGSGRSLGPLILGHVESGLTQVLSPGVDLGGHHPYIDPYSQPAVRFFDETFPIAIPPLPGPPGDDEERESVEDCLLSGLLEGLGVTDLEGVARLAFPLDLVGDPVGAFGAPLLSYAHSQADRAPASMGFGWSLSLHAHLEEEDEGRILRYLDGSGSSLRWNLVGGSYVPTRADNHVEAARNEEDEVFLTFPDQTRLDFDRHGRLLSRDLPAPSPEAGPRPRG